jgi:hypothetical protein
MPVVAKCPSCGAPLSEASLLALAPICGHCGAVITSVGGTLGLTGAYGIGDRTVTRRRVEADLAVFREYQEKYRGMKEACMQQLGWGVERYAQLPQRPELLPLKNVPFPWNELPLMLILAPVLFVVSYGAVWVICFLLDTYHVAFQGKPDLWGPKGPPFLSLIAYGATVAPTLVAVYPHFRARVDNGTMPRENARRQKAYESAVAVALKAAEPLKAAEDHRLRIQIRELESLAKTIDAKAAEVRQLLITI